MDAGSLVSLITGGAGAVAVLAVFLGLILSDKLHTSGEFRRMEQALQLEKEAHAETTRALAAAAERADAAVRASQLIADAFSGRRHASTQSQGES